MKHFLKFALPFVAMAVLIYIAVIAFGLWASYEVGKRLDIGHGTSTNPRLVRLEIGDRIFMIPQNHIWSREDWKGGRVSGVNMHALLPAFEPNTASNLHEFKKPGWNRTISFLLSEHNTPGSYYSSTSMTRKEIFHRMTHESSSGEAKSFNKKEGVAGLELWIKLKTTFKSELYVGAKRNGDFYWLECSGEGEHSHPSCSTYVEYSNRTVIKYTFPKKFLLQWEELDNQVLRFIASFDQSITKGRK